MTTQAIEKHHEAEFMKKKASDLIEESVEAGPHRLAEINIELSSIRAYFGEMLDKILVFKASRLEDLRTELKTMTAAKSKWNSTDEGRNEIIIRGILGRIKEQISVIKQRINVMRDGIFDQY